MYEYLSYFVTDFYKDFVNFCNEKLQEIGISQGLLFFILYIGKNPNCAPGKLSSDLNFDTGHTTRSITKLEQVGFVIREKNEADKRAYILNLTQKGKDAFLLSHNLFEEWDNKVMEDMDKEDREQLIFLLKKLDNKKEGLDRV